jgi:hypothetical protein
MRVFTLVESDPHRPLCPACGGGEIVRTVIGRAGETQAELGYCAGIYDSARRRVVRRSCGWVGGLAGP